MVAAYLTRRPAFFDEDYSALINRRLRPHAMKLCPRFMTLRLHFMKLRPHFIPPSSTGGPHHRLPALPPPAALDSSLPPHEFSRRVLIPCVAGMCTRVWPAWAWPARRRDDQLAAQGPLLPPPRQQQLVVCGAALRCRQTTRSLCTAGRQQSRETLPSRELPNRPDAAAVQLLGRGAE
jgi:hypothetical protein